ncbi:UNVERIFIED_CONTAM: hypothetical protein GTU68_041152, partial [Idotea baltica]|nr:hypothetical protein [Idotea baltica]
MLQQEREELKFVLAAHKTSCKRPRPRPVSASALLQEIEIKEEPMDTYDDAQRQKPARPTSLALGGARPSRPSSHADLGISIETPSSGLR